MQSHIVLHLDESEILPKLTDESSNTLLENNLKKYILEEGFLIVQSKSFYFANVEIFESSFSNKVWIELSTTAPSLFMFVNLNKTTCYLSYWPTGKYRKVVQEGMNTLICINIMLDWFIYQCSNIPEFENLLSSYTNRVDKIINLRQVSITKNLIKSINNSFALSNKDEDAYYLVNKCISQYYNEIKTEAITPDDQQDRADRLKKYIEANFMTSKVDTLNKLAKTFKVSVRTMDRLSRIAFGSSIHEQVIKLRMEYAVALLLNTDKPIKEIATLCGYNEPHYFSKAFKNYAGEIPIKFRNINFKKNC